MVGNAIVDKVMKKYGVPEWVKPYVYAYIKEDPMDAVKKGLSFIDVKRKRGKITGNFVELPNLVKFEVEDVARIISLFYYGEDESSKMALNWSKEPHDFDAKRYADHFAATYETEQKHLRAIKNMLEGLGFKPKAEAPFASALFEKISSISDWKERVIAYDLILKTSYGNTFGNIFYKVFYPVMPEYMRSFGKAFSTKDEESKWGYEEARRIISSGEITGERLKAMLSELLPLVGKVINANMAIAKKAGINREVSLLRDIAIVYPIQIAKDCGLQVYTDKEISALLSSMRTEKSSAKE